MKPSVPPSVAARRLLGSALALVLAVSVWVFGAADAIQVYTDANYRAPPGASLLDANQASRLAEGEYLSRVGNCVACHTAPGGAAFAGGRAIATPFGNVHSTNLTPDPRYGLGGWSADDFWHAMHHGKSRDGRRLSPAFPYTSYTHVSRADSDALFAYLQALAPVAKAPTPSSLDWPLNTQAALAVWRALYFWPQERAQAGAASQGSSPSAAAAPVAEPAGAAPGGTALASVARGAYLVQGLGHCSECHGARGPLGGLKSGKQLAGAVLPGPPWYAPSLERADQAGALSPAQTVALLQGDVSSQMFATGPMAEVVLHGTQYLRDADAQAIAAYLQSVAHTRDPLLAEPPLSASTVTQAGADAGAAKLYEDRCAQCHGKNGQGQSGAYPALAGNRAVVMVPPNNAVLSVLYGGFAPATAKHPRPFGMPPYLLTLSDAEVAAVLTHVRTAWGNRGEAVSALQVQQIRQAQARQ